MVLLAKIEKKILEISLVLGKQQSFEDSLKACLTVPQLEEAITKLPFSQKFLDIKL